MVEFNFGLVESIVFTFGFLIGAVIISEALLFILERVIKPLTAKTKTTLDDRLIEAVKTPVRLLGIILGVYLTVKPLYPTALFFSRDAEFWLVTLLILWAGIVGSNIVNAFITWYYQELSETNKAKAGVKISQDILPMLRRIVKITIHLITAIIVLDRFGIEITPLITALGIGGLAVALAIKDTLANFFAGIYLLTDKPIKIGEFISLDNENSPVKGFVEEVGWRTTRIRTRGNFTYYIPNEKITLNSIVNYSRGRENNWKGSSVEVGITYNSNAKKALQILLNSVKKVQKNSKYIVKDSEPFARIESFGKNSIVLKVFYRINNYFETEAAAGEIREQILADFKKHKITPAQL